MASVFQSPQRPLPGGFDMTPAPFQGQNPGFGNRLNSLNNLNSLPPRPNAPVAASGASAGQSLASTSTSAPVTRKSSDVTPALRAAKTINDALKRDDSYPELDSYLTQGISSAYDSPTQAGQAFSPFRKQTTYKIPDEIFEQYNNAQLSTMMGLFADVHHAWVTIDNSVYLWDYTSTNPTILGVEDQPSNVTGVAMVTPRDKVFFPRINKLLVVATLSEIRLYAIAAQAADGTFKLDMYETKMGTSVRGLYVSKIVGTADGRIFFGGSEDNDVYELTYSGEERWFYSRCQKINHTGSRFTQWTPNFSFSSNKDAVEHVAQIAVDDSRSLLYTLSSKSNIRVFSLKSDGLLRHSLSKMLEELVRDVFHMINSTPLIGPGTRLISISVISAQEASKLYLMATTSNGVRLYLSGSSNASWASAGGMSFQISHIRFPPAVPGDKDQEKQEINNLMPRTPDGRPVINTAHTALDESELATRFPPGFFFTLRSADVNHHIAFMSAPDTGRIAKGPEPESHSRFVELYMSLQLDGKAEDIGIMSKTPSATKTPLGFANELATQFDGIPTDIAILTNSGISVFRRQRLIDVFYTAAKLNDGPGGREGAAKKFIRLYGRVETAAAALAIACGESATSRLDTRYQFYNTQVRDNEVQEFGRKVFIEHGGKPTLNDNIVLDQNVPAVESVRPSPRHDAVALFISRNVRTFWKSKVVVETVTPTGGLTVQPVIGLDVLKASQERLLKLREFLNANRSFIEGLSGPEAARNLPTRQDEINLQAEHRALHALEILTTNAIEGISFVQTMFKERLEEIMIKLKDAARQSVRDLTFEDLFSTVRGHDVARELVKAIVDRNIAKGANVETVADALRRQCGRFCSAEDVVIFKAQEQVRRAHEQGIDSEYSRNLLNESMRLYKSVAEQLPFEQLAWALEQYQKAQFWAGGIQLALDKARELDRGNRAFSWILDGRPPEDPRAPIFGRRKRCYVLVQQCILSADEAFATAKIDTPEWTTINQRRREAYEEVQDSNDEAFQTDLYDWYLSRNESNKLLEVTSPSIVSYLQRRSAEDVQIADLLWRYYAVHKHFFESANVLLDMAESEFPLSLDQRIVYLSQAKTNANQNQPGVSRRKIQDLQKRATSLLDLASLQDEIRGRLKEDERTTADKAAQWDRDLGGKILDISALYNNYADSANYYDICLLIYRIGNHDNPVDVYQMWRNLIEQKHMVASDSPSQDGEPYTVVAQAVRETGLRLNRSEVYFPLHDLIPILKKYQFEQQRGLGAYHWVVDIFLDLELPAENIYNVLENMLNNEEVPFQGANRKYIAHDLIYVAKQWYADSVRSSSGPFGGSENARAVEGGLRLAAQSTKDSDMIEDARALIARIGQHLA